MNEKKDDSLDVIESELMNLQPRGVSERLRAGVMKSVCGDESNQILHRIRWGYVAAGIGLAACMVVGLSVTVNRPKQGDKSSEAVAVKKVEIKEVDRPAKNALPTLMNYRIALTESEESFEKMLDDHHMTIAMSSLQLLDIKEMLDK